MGPPAKVLLPLLTLLGTTATAAVVAQKYVPKYMANKYRHRQQMQMQRAASADESQHSHSEPEVEHEAVVNTKEEVDVKPTIQQRRPSSSSLAVMMVLQDGHLMISVFGMCVMVLVVLVSLAVVMINEDVVSPNDLQLFAPLMMVAMGLIFVGLIARTLKGEATHCPVYTSAAPKSSHTSRTRDVNKDRDNEPRLEKRVSKCPFGFG